MTRRLAIIVSFATAFVLASAAPALAHTYTYTVEKRGDVESSLERFAEIAAETFASPRGWSLNLNVDFNRVSSDGDFRLILASPDEVEDAAPGCVGGDGRDETRNCEE